VEAIKKIGDHITNLSKMDAGNNSSDQPSSYILGLNHQANVVMQLFCKFLNFERLAR